MDAHVAAAGGTVEHLPQIERPPVDPEDGVAHGRSLGGYLDDLAAGIYSWTWDLPPDRLAAALDEVRQWLTDELGDPDRVRLPYSPIRWHRYVLTPAA